MNPYQCAPNQCAPNQCAPNPCTPNPCTPNPCGPSLGSYQYCPPNCWGGPAYNVKCSQTNFCSSSSLVPSVTLDVNEGSCTDVLLSINGSGLSIVVCCSGKEKKAVVAGTICSCPNNFTSTLALSYNGGCELGTMSWCVCGCNVCGTGHIPRVHDTDNMTKRTVSILGCVSCVCGIRTICITSIIIN